jgi:hypothetical protein
LVEQPVATLGVFAEIVIILALIYIPLSAAAFEHVPLPPIYWIGLTLYGPILYSLDWLRRAQSMAAAERTFAERRRCDMKVIIMGCGRVGERLSRLMVDRATKWLLIDSDPGALARLGLEFKGRRIRGWALTATSCWRLVLNGLTPLLPPLIGQCQHRRCSYRPQYLPVPRRGPAV